MATSKKATTSMELTVSTPTPNVLEMLQAELDKLQAVNDSPWKSGSGQLEGFGNIRDEKKVENLIRAFASVRGREKAYNEAQEELQIESAPIFKVGGATAQEWKDDIQLQIKKVTYEARYNELKELMNEAKSFLSQEDKKKMFFEKLSKKLGGDTPQIAE